MTLKNRIAFYLIYCIFISNAYSQNINSICISKDSTFSIEKTLGSLFTKNQPAIFLGISHKVDVNQNLYANLILLLNKQLGIRHIICEASHGESYLLNKFLETGEDRYLQYEYEWSEEMRKGFKILHEYNKSLAQDDKLVFIGVDAALHVTPVVLSLKELMPATKPPSEIAPFVDSIKSIVLPLKFNKELTERQAIKEREQSMLALRNEVTSKSKYYQDFLGDKFQHLLMIIDNNASMLAISKRDMEMYKGIKRAKELFHIEEGIFGMIGSSHTSMKQNWTLASQLKEGKGSPYFNNTFNIAVHYENSSSSWGNKTVVIEKSVLDDVYGKNSNVKEMELKKLTGCDNFIMEVSEQIPLKDWCDYLIYITGGKPLQNLMNQK